MTATYDQCRDTTAAGRRCSRTGTYTIPALIDRGRCRQHAIAAARTKGIRKVLDMRRGVSFNPLEVPRRRPRFVKPRTYDQVMTCLPKLRNLAELRTVIGVVIDAADEFPGFGNRESDLRHAIRDAKDRLKPQASQTDREEFGFPGWEPQGVGAIAAAAMRRIGVEVPSE